MQATMGRLRAMAAICASALFACQAIVGIEDTSTRNADASAGSSGVAGSSGIGGSGASGGSAGTGGSSAAGGSSGSGGVSGASGAGASGGSAGSAGTAGADGGDAAPCDDFSISPLPGISIPQGGSGAATLVVVLGSCFTGAIDVTATTTNGVSATATTIPSGATSAQITVSASGSAAFGLTLLPLSFSGGGKSHVADLPVTVKGVPGELDPNFTIYATGTGTVRALAVEPDGDIVIGINPGTGMTGWQVARVKASGAIDAGFTAPSSLPSSGGLADATIAPNGQIVLAGSVSGGDGVAAVRLSATGAPDPVLGANGTYTIGPGVFSTTASPRAVAVQGDGKIVISGSMATEGFVTRINPNGPAVPPVPGKTDFSHVFPTSSMATVGIQPSRIVVGGTANSHVIVAAVTMSGAPDQSFGTANGSAVFAPEAFENVHDGVLTSTAIFLSGAVQGGADVYPAIFRFSPNGTQPTYTSTNPPEAYNYRYYGIAAQIDGKVVAVGFGGTTASGTRSVVTRFNADGSVDQTFAPNEPVKGSKVFQIGGNTFMRAIAVAPDGGIIVGGSSPSGPTVVRLWN